MSKALLERFKRNESDFLRRFITVDETTAKTVDAKGETAPEKAKTVSSAEKAMVTAFWDSPGILLIDYLEKGKSKSGVYFGSSFDKLKAKIATKRPHLKEKVLLHQDNACVHTSTVAMAKIHELQFELIDHPPYSPDLAPSEFSLFPKFKVWLGGQKFLWDEEFIASVGVYFGEKDGNYYLEGLKRPDHRRKKCMGLKGDYVEK
jgi:histone-lysine N-methyltransferase SETMAR